MRNFVVVLVVATISLAAFGGTSSNKALYKVIQKQGKEIKALKAEIAALKAGKKTNSKKVPLSSAALHKISTLKRKIAVLDSRIKGYQSKIRNVKYKIVKMTNADRKGWYYRKGGSIKRLGEMKKLPKNWNRRDIRIVYISKDEKRQKIKEQYQKELNKLESEKQALEKELAQIS